MDNDDNQSVGTSGSTSSVSNVRASCPYCTTTLQMRYMFKHIYDKHYPELIVNTTREALEDMIANKSPFFVANPDNQALYGCMSCYKTFTNETRAVNHFGGGCTCINTHVANMVKLSKESKQILTPEETKHAWLKTLSHFVPCFDRSLVEVMETFNCFTDTVELSIRLLEEIQEKIIKGEDEEWNKLFSKIVLKIDKVNRECGGDVMGFMKFTTRCKWLPHPKQLHKIMTDNDIESAKKYKLKSKAFLKEFTTPVVTLEEPEAQLA